jgi:hypothetical protein
VQCLTTSKLNMVIRASYCSRIIHDRAFIIQTKSPFIHRHQDPNCIAIQTSVSSRVWMPGQNQNAAQLLVPRPCQASGAQSSLGCKIAKRNKRPFIGSAAKPHHTTEACCVCSGSLQFTVIPSSIKKWGRRIGKQLSICDRFKKSENLGDAHTALLSLT